MHACLNGLKQFKRFLLLIYLIGMAGLVHSAGIEVRTAALTFGEEGYTLNADFSISLGPSLEELVSHSIPLYFLLEFELRRPRWYWVDEQLVTKNQSYRLAYHALTRQYRLSTGGALHQNFSSLAEALGVLSRIHHWSIASTVERGQDKFFLKTGETYSAAVRLKLDTTQLPKPFQVSVISNKDWGLSGEIRRWNFVAKNIPERDDK